MKQKFINIILLSLILITNVTAIDLTHRPDSHAPIGIMADHWHAKGEWMASYRMMFMNMDSLSETANGYMNSPTKMDMQMHMFGMMWAPSQQITLMAMTSLLDKEMISESNIQMLGMGMSANTIKVSSTGLSDSKILGLIPLINTHKKKSHLSTGVSLPTGAINKTNNNNMTLGYGMQNGSGTIDLINSATLLNYQQAFSAGTQLSTVYRLGKNKKHYRLGHQLKISTWIAKPWNPFASSSIGLTYIANGKIDGNHSDITNTSMNPAMDAENSGNNSINLTVGLNIKLNPIGLKNSRFSCEWLTPLQQNQNGAQMKRESFITFGYQQKF